MRRQHGFSIIELLIVVMIIGIIASIAIPNLLDAVNRSKQKRTMSDIRSIATAWEARATDLNRYNAAGTALDVIETCSEYASHDDLSAVLVPTYTKLVPSRDGWGNLLRFGIEYPLGDESHSTNYLIWAPARDATFTATAEDAGGGTTNFNDDIIFSHGVFVQYPEGVQVQ